MDTEQHGNRCNEELLRIEFFCKLNLLVADGFGESLGSGPRISNLFAAAETSNKVIPRLISPLNAAIVSLSGRQPRSTSMRSNKTTAQDPRIDSTFLYPEAAVIVIA